jgi:hypothetical protein
MSEDIKQITEHEALDRILKYLVDNRTDGPIGAYKICKEVFPDQKQQLVFFLIKKLLNKSDIIKSHVQNDDLNDFQVFIEATDITEIFLKQGGFQGQLAKEQADKAERDRLDGLNKRKLEAEVEVIEFQKGLGKRLTIWGFIITIISIFSSVMTTIIQNKGDNKQRTIESLVNKTDSLTTRIIKLEKGLENNSDSTINRERTRHYPQQHVSAMVP